ncbi:thioesterase family protein [Ectothiorhodospiraceae bacterium WFHF3C12]|nr:thioesterase family protein [Ectothiorhodospiraceae bacterium WFHF3C12]
MASALFLHQDDHYVPTEAAGGPWSPDLLHGGPPTGLLAHCMDQIADPDKRLARLTVDLLRPVPSSPLAVSVETIRTGARLELLAATLTHEGRAVCRGTALFVAEAETEVPEHGRFPARRLPEPAPGPTLSLAQAAGWENEQTLPGLHTTAEVRPIEGARGRGHGRVWMRLPVPVVAGEAATPAICAATLADFGNGVGQLRLNERTGSINADVSLHLHRLPTGEWIGFDAASRMQPRGVGMAETLLYDHEGLIGRVTQTLMAMPLYGG